TDIYVVPVLYEAWEKRKRVQMPKGVSKTCMAGVIFVCAGLGVLRAQSAGQNAGLSTDNYKEVLEYINQNSPALQADRLQMQAEVKGHHTDLVPSNPDFTFGYAFVGEGGRHRRVDFETSQSFDFPSVYLYKARTARWSDSAAVYDFAHRRALLMMEAENLCMEMIYINSLLRYSFEERMRTAYDLSSSTEVQLEKGQVSIMDRNKAVMNLLQMKKNFADLKARQGEIAASLKRLTGGEEVSLTQDLFPQFLLPEDFETFFARITANNPFLLQAKSAASAAEQNLKANVAESFPSFTVGYKSEDAFTPQDVLHGFYIGMNVPLWANKNHVKQAKLEAQAAQSREQDAKNELRARLETLYRKVAELYPVVQEYRQNISALNNLPYLEEALKSGEFSLLFYIDELQYQFDVIDSYLQSERDLAQAWSELKWLSGWKE
ncbi:MAG: TolC family protein, partial [Bacteroidales bacterium]|nr:TolC family protein [Bacteroidales bacterium]